MTITYENIAELIKEAEQELTYTKSVYNEAEAELIETVGNFVMGAEVEHRAYGLGKVINYSGATLENIAVEIEFIETTKKFSLQHIITVGGNFVNFANAAEVKIIWDEAAAVHNTLTQQVKDAKNILVQLERKSVKLAEEAKRADARLQAVKTKALKDFQTRAQHLVPQNETDEFYYALGWITKHCGTVTAALPDYLENAFNQHFGPEAPRRVMDSKKHYPSGWQAQWAWSFTLSLKKIDDVPCIIADKLSPSGKTISDTSFVWELVDNYGFQFGKQQDVEKIRACVPSDYIYSFESGLV